MSETAIHSFYAKPQKSRENTDNGILLVSLQAEDLRL